MNMLYFFTSFYGALNNCGGMPYWVLAPVRRITRYIIYCFLPVCLAKHTYKKGTVEKNLIISLTSFPARINEVWMVIESLKRQTVLPEKIILWLSRKQFPSIEDIPYKLKQCEDSIFEIRIVEEDIRSHKKYFYTLKEFPNSSFITCDDDVYYDQNMVKRLVDTSKLYPGCIIANNTTKIAFDESGSAKSYLEWPDNYVVYNTTNLIQIGVGGVLYPPNCLNHLVINKELFWELAPMADDIWLNAMARLNGTPVVQTKGTKLVLPIKTDAPSLSSVNNGENMNDKQIKQIREFLISNSYVDVYSSKCNIEFKKGEA